MSITHNVEAAVRSFPSAVGAYSAAAGAASVAVLTAKPRVQGSAVPNDGMGAFDAWSPPD